MKALIIPNNPAPMPATPPELAQKLATFDGMDLIRGSVPAVVVEQAKRHLAQLEAYHRPARENVLEAWLRMLRGGVAPITETEFSSRLFAIRIACQDLPGWVWTTEMLKLAWRFMKFFPTAAEAFELLDPIAQKGMRGMSQVRLLSQAKPSRDEDDGDTVRISVPQMRRPS